MPQGVRPGRPSDPDWTIIVPVKLLYTAKSRLRLPTPHRRPDYALAFARDTVAAARRCPDVTSVVVVTADPSAARALAADGARVCRQADDTGLNSAIRHGRSARRGPIAALTADLPALRSAELSAALNRAADVASAFVPDADGTGTVLLTATSPDRLHPRFGPESAAAHREAGALRLDGDWPGLRRDVDTAANLALAVTLGIGRHSAELID